MTSFICPTAVTRILSGDINLSDDKFGVILLDGSQVPDRNDSERRDLANEVSGTGYRPGGNQVAVSVVVDDDGKTFIVLGGSEWPESSITARYAAYYRKTVNAARDDLIAVIDFGKEVQSLNDLFSLTDSEIETSTAP